jgi:hypothetical protein
LDLISVLRVAGAQNTPPMQSRGVSQRDDGVVSKVGQEDPYSGLGVGGGQAAQTAMFWSNVTLSRPLLDSDHPSTGLIA